jgi:hypothetical protein
METIDKFDRMLGGLKDLPDVLHTKPSTVVTTLPLIGKAQTFIIQTYRQREIRDTVFLQYVDDERSLRLVIPPKIADAIAARRDALTSKSRKKAAKAAAAARKERGEPPAFMRKASA